MRKLALFHHLGYLPHAAQLQVHKSRAKRRVVASGVRVGKSTIGAYECVSYLLEPREKALGWLCGPTYDLSNRIFKRVVEVFHAKLAHRILSFDPRQHSLVVANFGGGRSELKGKSCDRPVALLGEALDFLVIDECAKLREDVWTEHLAPRVLDLNGDVLLLSTPDGPGWFHAEYMRGARKDPDPSYASWSFPTSANPHIDPARIEGERSRLDPDVFAAQYEARFVGVPREVCPTCLGPVEGRPGVAIIGDEFDTHYCPTCGDFTYADGRSAVGFVDGERRVMIIRLEPGLDEDVALPT